MFLSKWENLVHIRWSHCFYLWFWICFLHHLQSISWYQRINWIIGKPVVTIQQFLFSILFKFVIYRCKVPECEFGMNNRDLPYNQSWLRHAIPSTNEKFDSCSRYAPKYWVTSQCSADMFDAATEISCTEYIHASDERNLQTEVLHQIERNTSIRTNIWLTFKSNCSSTFIAKRITNSHLSERLATLLDSSFYRSQASSLISTDACLGLYSEHSWLLFLQWPNHFRSIITCILW